MMAAVASTIIGKKLVEKAVSDMYEAVKGKLNTKLSRIQVRYFIDNICSRADETAMVKTLWQVDKPVDVRTFYCDSHVLINRDRRIVKKIDDFSVSGHILLEGIAGQGKSILAKYLCINELQGGTRVPLLIELRKIADNETLIDHIYHCLEKMGLDLPEPDLKLVLECTDLFLILDGYDETNPGVRSKFLSHLEQIVTTNKNIKVLLTSRPGSGLEYCHFLTVAKLDNVRNDEYKSIIYKLTDDKEIVEQLIERVDNSKSNVKELLITPLLITLLVITYKATKELPESLSDFYDDIFNILLKRHDGSKPGFKRPRKCNIDDNEYRQIFEATCCFLKQLRKNIYTFDELYCAVKEAVNFLKIETSAQSFLEDIIEITCLIVNDGNQYRFIHKTVQEFYTSSFYKKLCNNSDKFAHDFYRKLSASETDFWAQELRFFKEIDKLKYTAYYEQKLIKSMLKETKYFKYVGYRKIKARNITALLKHFGINIVKYRQRRDIGIVGNSVYYHPFVADLITPEIAADIASTIESVPIPEIIDKNPIIKYQRSLDPELQHADLMQISLFEMYKLFPTIQNKCMEMAEQLYCLLLTKRKGNIKYIINENNKFKTASKFQLTPPPFI